MAVDEPELPEVAPLPDPGRDSAPAPEALSEAVPEEEASDLGSPGFDTSQPPTHELIPHPADTTGFAEVPHDVSQDLYQPASSVLSYPPGVGMPEDMSNADYFQPRPVTNGITYPQQQHQASDLAYADGASASHQQAQDIEPTPVQPTQIPSQQNHQTSSRTGARRSLPSGSNQHQSDYASSTEAVPASSSWQSTNNSANPTPAYSESPATSQGAPPRQGRSRQAVAQATYDSAAQDALQAATTLTQAALQKRPHASPTTRTVSPFANPIQAAQVARAKSRQSQRAHSRQTASPFQQSTTTSQPTTAVAAASSLYNATSGTNSDSVPSYDQYSRYSNTPTQATTTGSRVAYEPYSQQAASSSSATSYSGYGAYDSRSQASNTPSLANPVTQNASPSYTKTTAPSSKSWAGGNGRRSSNAYSSNKAPASSNPSYNTPVTSAQQQSTNMQSFNVRPQSTTPAQSRPSGNTSASYAQQPRQQPSQQTYNSYSSQPHAATNQQQQQQQDWYGFGSTSNTTPNYGSGSYGQHRSMNLAGNTYTSMNDQDALYQMLRDNSRH